MPWNEPGSNRKDPWNNRPGNQGPPDLDELLRKLAGRFSGLFGGRGRSSGSPGGGGSSTGTFSMLAIFAIAVLVWLASGWYQVEAQQRGVVLRFGRLVEITSPGLRWHMPFPIERRLIVDVGQVRAAQSKATMLTQDENIVELEVAVQYRVKDPSDYVFNLRLPDNVDNQNSSTLYRVMESAAREVVGKNKMDFILGEGRAEIAAGTKDLMQRILDGYGAGLEITSVNLPQAQPPEAVQGAFADAIKAREDGERFKNEAEAYANGAIPRARGEAARLTQEADAYAQEVVARADGEAGRFLKLLSEYIKAPDVTRERLYLETMQVVLSRTGKVLTGEKGSNNLLYLPLDKLMQGADATHLPPLGSPATPSLQNTPEESPAEPERRSRSERSGRLGR